MFVATTALTEFWDTSRRVHFLGPWCLRGDRETGAPGRDYGILPSPWATPATIPNAVEALHRYDAILFPRLARRLDEIHGEAHAPRYWRVLLGAWFLHFLHVAYDRHLHVNAAFAQDPDVETILLDPRSYRVPRDTAEALSFVTDDPFNLQIYSLLVGSRRPDLPTRAFSDASEWTRAARLPATPTRLRATAAAIESWSSRSLARLKGKGVKAVVCEPYFSRELLWKIVHRSGFSVIPYVSEALSSPRVLGAQRTGARAGLALLRADDEFEAAVATLLPYALPSIYLEGYAHARKWVEERWERPPPALASATGWYGAEDFKFLAAHGSERGSRLLAIQHGGGYGCHRFFPAEELEREIADAYLSWGWGRSPGLLNTPSPMLSAMIDAHAGERSRAPVVFVGNSNPRYLHRFQSGPLLGGWEAYFDWQSRFLGALPSRIFGNVVFRPYPVDYGRGLRARHARAHAGIAWDTEPDLAARFANCRLAVIDHCQTTFLQTFVSDLPTVLFWDPQRWEMREEAVPHFEDLFRAGILYREPEAAAAKVAEVHDNPRAWWDAPSVQQARRRFIERFALAREDWVESWVRALTTGAEERIEVPGGSPPDAR